MRRPAASTFLSLGWLVLALGATGRAAPSITAPPADVVTNVGGAASFQVATGSSLAKAYQWFRDGRPITGATREVLVIAPVSPGDAGGYSVRVADSSGEITSAPAMLTAQPAPATPIVDSSFRGDAALAGIPSALLPLTDGRVILATYSSVTGARVVDSVRAELFRLLPDGRIDPGFRRGLAAVDEFESQVSVYPPRIETVLAQPDGRVLVAGHFFSFNGVPCAGLVRLTTAGEVDPTFAPEAQTIRDTRLFQIRVALQADGRVLVFDNDSRRLRRLLPDGRQDLSFRVQSSISLNALAVNEAGRIFYGDGPPSFSGNAGHVFALQPDGTPDPAFPTHGCDTVQRLYPLKNGGVVVSTQYDSGPVFPGMPRVRFPVTTFRLGADGARDPGFPIKPAFLYTPPRADGAMLFGGQLIGPNGTEEGSYNLGVVYNGGIVVVSEGAQLRVFDRNGQLWIAGAFSVYNGVPTSRVARLNLVPTESLTAPVVLTAWADQTEVALNSTVTAHVAVSGPGPLTYLWNGSTATTEPNFTFTAFAETRGFSVTVSNSAGVSKTVSVALTVRPPVVDLQIVAQPHRLALMPGKWAEVFVSVATSAPPIRTEWKKNGVSLGVKGDVSLVLGDVNPAIAGTYVLTVSDSTGKSVTSDPIVVTVGDDSRLTNLSTRAWVGAGDEAAVLGFVIPPGHPRTILLRGIGPSLAKFWGAGAQPGVLADARLDLFDSAGRAVARSKSWGQPVLYSPQSADFEKVGAFALDAGSRDAGLLITELGPGSYTARLSGLENTTGTGLIELYEYDRLTDHLVNLSSRVFIPRGGNAIAGLTIGGAAAKRVLIRAVGPGLAAFGVTGALGDPRLEVRDASGAVVAANDNWQTQPGSAEVAAATASLGAFALANGSTDSALVVTLPPGSYSAVVTGPDASSGVVLVEAYELP